MMKPRCLCSCSHDPPPPRLQYRNANMKPHKHASYLRLAALKDLFWSAEDILKARAGLMRGATGRVGRRMRRQSV